MTDPFKTPLQKVMFYDKYSRYNHKKQRREVWTESVTRVMDFFNTHLLKTYGRNPIPNEVWAEIANAFANTDVMPSMRILQMAGPALERCHVGGYNCVSGETEYVTRDGIKTFTETVGTTQTVLCLDGQWRSAEVRQFGEALVNRVTLRPGRQSRTHLRKTVYATADHGWVTTRGHVRDLRVGDEVIANAQAALHSPEEWVRGFLFGDGTVQDGCARVRLCGKKVGHLPRFYATGARVSYPESNEGDPTVSWEKGRFADCKELPTIPHPSWMEGYLAADGGKQDRQPTLSTTREDVVEFVQRHAAELGIAVTGLATWTKPSNYGDRQPLYKLGIRPAGQVTWRVLSIEPTGEVVPVYCVTEPVTHTFTLAHGLVSMNCAYLPLESPKDFADLLYILMQGTGVGFSVEDVYVKNWPKVSAPRPVPRLVVEIADTTESWCDAVEFAISGALDGREVEFDYSAIRPFGAPLKTKGGKASGPAPLRRLLEFIKKTIRNREGKQLRAIDLHDIACYCGQIVQVGGVRRAALISISDPQDEEMKKAKNGKFWTHHPQRMMANNTVAFDTEDEFHQYFAEEFTNLKESGTGERGLFFRFALDEQLPARRDSHHRFGLNPCAEIILRPRQFCNLSIAVCRETDTIQTLLAKVKAATLFGLIQSTMTHFTYIDERWERNCRDEHLLGVDITGQFDNIQLFTPANMSRLQEAVNRTVEQWSTVLQIPMSAATTCVKPSGNSAQLLNTSSGVHPRYAPYYIRTIRIGAGTTMAKFLSKSGVPHAPEVGQDPNKPSVWVFSFPIAAPKGNPTRHDVTALDQLEHWKLLKTFYTEHNPSCTIYVKPEEWDSVERWLKDNKEIVGGLSFLPFDGGEYELAPYKEISKNDYEEAVMNFPKLNFEEFLKMDKKDETTVTRDYQCLGNLCEF